MKYVFLFACAAVVAAASVGAQSSNNPSTVSSAWSSSQDGQLQIADGSVPASAALPSAPAASAAAAQDDDNSYHGWHGHDVMHRLTFEAGGGFNPPAGDKSYITWGGQFTLGGGVNVNRWLAMMLEYQFLDDKIPGAVINESGAEGGHYHIWSLTLDPVIDLLPKRSNDVYVTGGGGFYRKVTDFTAVEPAEYCSFYGCGVVGESQTVGSFSSNQAGVNFGAGYQHRFGGMYGEGHTRFFVEARYLDVMSPAVDASANGLGVTAIGSGTKVVPVSVGFRW